MHGLLEAFLGPKGSSPAALARVTRGVRPADPGAAGVLFGGRQSSAGVRVTEEDALSLSGVFAACNLLSGIIGTLPLTVYRTAGGRREPALTDPAYSLLRSSPNPEATAAVARRALEFHRLLWGNAYAEIVWAGNGRAAQLWPVEPWRVRPVRDESGALAYQIDGRRLVAAADMVHVPLISLDGVTGRSFVDYALSSLGTSIATQEFAARAFGNGSRPGGILKHPGTPPPEQRAAFRQAWEQQHAGPEKAHKVAVVWGGWEYATDGAFDPTQLQLLEQRRFSVEEVSRWLNVPPALLYELGRATWGNAEQMNLQFVLYSISPTLVVWEQEFDRKLLSTPTTYCKHNTAAFLRGDSSARATFYRQLFEMGVLSINDILELEERNPVEGGDTRFVPSALRTLEDAVNPPEPPPPPAQAPVPTPEPPDPEDPEDDPADPPQEQSAPRPVKPALAALLADTLRRMARNEARALERVKPAKLAQGLDAIYADHERLLADALAPVWEAAALLDAPPAKDPGTIAASWCAESRRQVEALADAATPADWPRALETLLAGWGGRPAAAALCALGD